MSLANPHPLPLSADLAGKNPVDLMPADPAVMDFRSDTQSTVPSTATWSKSADSVPVLRVETSHRPGHAYATSVRWNFRETAHRGDVLLARFLARAEYARQESGEAILQFSVQQTSPSFARHVLVPLTAGPEWTLIEIPFFMVREADPAQGEIQLSFGTIAQAVEIASLEVLNFGDRANLAELPQTRFTYRGREAGAAWREAALRRIEEIRTAPLTLSIVDDAGRPIPDAQISIKLVQPAFMFGTSVDSSFILNDTPDAKRYRETLLALFDTAVIENGMKWQRWSGSTESRDEALRAVDWLEAQKLRQRGHTLVWPGDKFSPRRIVQMAPPRAELPLLIKEHIRDIMTATRGRIAGWDVINELMHERDYLNYMPETEAAEWFKVARETDPQAKLFINEYSMLNSPRSPDQIARYLALIERLRAAGAPIDGLGVQGHIGRQVRDPEDVLRDLDLLSTAGLEIQITEFDINSPDEELQADYTRDFLIALYSHPNVTGFTKWGFWERKHWKPDAAMFRADWSEKPNAKVWRDLVRGDWFTQVKVTTDDAGRAATRGHLGAYEFTVTTGEKTVRQMRTLTIEGADLTIQVP